MYNKRGQGDFLKSQAAYLQYFIRYKKNNHKWYKTPPSEMTPLDRKTIQGKLAVDYVFTKNNSYGHLKKCFK